MTAPVVRRSTDSAEDALWRKILAALALDRSGVLLAVLEQALLNRDVDAAMTAVRLTNFTNALALMQSDLQSVRELGWLEARQSLPATLVDDPLIGINLAAQAVERPEVLQAVLQQDLSRIQGVTLETQQAIRQMIIDGLNAGAHPTVLARSIREQVGLNTQQAKAVAKYRVSLESEERESDQVDRMVAKRVRKLINQRARTIARTEVARALNDGKRLQYQRLERDGLIDLGEYDQIFDTAEDERVCPICEPLDGQRAPIGGAFFTSVGPMPGPPIHVQCRCTTHLSPHRENAPLRSGKPAT